MLKVMVFGAMREAGKCAYAMHVNGFAVLVGGFTRYDRRFALALLESVCGAGKSSPRQL
ncbi:MAG: hypothetical protein H7335_15055 [Massilia sp.]|nr:hypothetical protein [Massilia sp.]